MQQLHRRHECFLSVWHHWPIQTVLIYTDDVSDAPRPWAGGGIRAATGQRGRGLYTTLVVRPRCVSSGPSVGCRDTPDSAESLALGRHSPTECEGFAELLAKSVDVVLASVVHGLADDKHNVCFGADR